MKNSILITLVALLFVQLANAQDRHDKGEFINAENKFYQEIQKSIEMFSKPAEASKPPVFKMDFSGVEMPVSADEFQTVWSGKPVSQGINACWSFSTTSFFESEVKRLWVRRSALELFIVYYEYIEKAKEYVRTRGTSAWRRLGIKCRYTYDENVWYRTL